jgi:hypothetical protein
MNIYGDVVTGEMVKAPGKVVDLALKAYDNDCRSDCSVRKLLKRVVSAEGIEPSTY